MVIPSQRHLFDIPASVTFLNCANMSPLLNTAREAGMHAVIRRSHPWEIIPADWFGPADELKKLFAALIYSDAQNIALVPSASYGIAIAAKNIQLKKGQKILVLDRQYPSNIYAWREHARISGAEIVTVIRKENQNWTEAVLAQIDEMTALVTVPNCHWMDGSLLDLERISRKTKEFNAALVIDASQSLGAYPLDINKIQPDFLVAVGYKWLLGSYGLGYLYISPKYFDGTPIEYSWLNKINSRDFSRLAEYTDAYEPGARRYDFGEFAGFISIPIAIAALKQIQLWGIADIAETLRRLTTKAGELALRAGLQITDTEIAGHLISIHFPEGSAGVLGKKLAGENIFVSVRGSSIRIAPHLYNTQEDIEKLFFILEKYGNKNAQ